jgi:hypothetical protein
VSEGHLADLRASGLSDDTIAQAGLYTEDQGAAVRDLLGWTRPAAALGECLVFPYFGPDGEKTKYHRLKPANPRPGKDSKPIKYEAAKGGGNRAYFPPLPAALEAINDPPAPLVITEGEKKALCASQSGFATIGLPGIWSWSRPAERDENGRRVGRYELIDDLAALKWNGRRVSIVFDTDSKPTTTRNVAKAAEALRTALAERGAVVQIVRLPLAPGEDKVGLDDYLCSHTPDDFRKLLATADTASPVALATRCLSDVVPEPVVFVVPGFVPVGKVSLFAGRGGLGKSAVTLDLAANLSTGRPAFGLTYDAPPPANVLLCFGEDDAADVVVPRLLAAGADLARIHEVQGVRGADGKRLPFSLGDCDVLAAELRKRPDVRLVVIDPVGVFAGRTGIDTHKEAPVQALLANLRDVAIASRVAVVLVAHVNKSSEAKARDRVSGSAAFVNSARAAFLFTDDESDGDGRRMILPLKVNYTSEPAGLTYDMRPLNPEEEAAVKPALAHLDADAQQALLRQLFRVRWLGTTTERADDVLQRKREVVRDVDRAADWLRGHIAARPRPSDDCAAEGNKALNLSRPGKWWRDSVLKPLLGGKAQRAGFGREGVWYYTLPSHPWPFPGLAGGADEEEPPAILTGPFRTHEREPRPIESAPEPSTPSPDSMPSMDSMDSMGTTPQQETPPPIESIEGKESIESGPVEDGDPRILCPDHDAEVF